MPNKQTLTISLYQAVSSLLVNTERSTEVSVIAKRYIIINLLWQTLKLKLTIRINRASHKVTNNVTLTRLSSRVRLDNHAAVPVMCIVVCSKPTLPLLE